MTRLWALTVAALCLPTAPLVDRAHHVSRPLVVPAVLTAIRVTPAPPTSHMEMTRARSIPPTTTTSPTTTSLPPAPTPTTPSLATTQNVATTQPASVGEQVWLQSAATRCIEFHESTDGELSPNLFQFEDGTWYSVTGLTGDPGSYPAAVQDAAAYKLYLERGWEPWTTRYVCGL